MKRLYLGNFPYSTTEADLRELLSDFGDAENVRVMRDPVGRSKGYGFADMARGGERAIDTLNGTQYRGRRLDVTEAAPPKAQLRYGRRERRADFAREQIGARR